MRPTSGRPLDRSCRSATEREASPLPPAPGIATQHLLRDLREARVQPLAKVSEVFRVGDDPLDVLMYFGTVKSATPNAMSCVAFTICRAVLWNTRPSLLTIFMLSTPSGALASCPSR